MTIGFILLIIVGLLVLFGVGQRVLDKMRLTDRQALLFIALITSVINLIVDVLYVYIDPRLKSQYVKIRKARG